MGAFVDIWATDGVRGSRGGLRFNALASGLVFYVYNEVSTFALGSLSGLSHSVANTAKRAVVIVGSAFAFGEPLGGVKAAGCTIAIGGVMLYAVADDLHGRLLGAPARPKTGKATKTS